MANVEAYALLPNGYLGSSSSAAWGLDARTQMNRVLDDPLLATFALGLVAVVHTENICSLCMTF